jgi:SAM-dependent methyltransferase
LRSVLTFPTEQTPVIDGIKHPAPFPCRLPEIFIAGATSEKGCCVQCGKPWERQYEYHEIRYDGGNRAQADIEGAVLSAKSTLRTGKMKIGKPIGWKSACDCYGVDDSNTPTDPCTVLDIFSGSGTTGVVAARLQRDYVGIDLSPEYTKMAAARIARELPLFNTVTVRSLINAERAPF